MKVAFINVGSELQAIGFRKMAAVAKKVFSGTEIYYIVPENQQYLILNSSQSGEFFSEQDMQTMASQLATSDLVCVSSFSLYADFVKELMALIKKINPATYLVWGGIHPIVVAEDAIEHADAICVGEGELAYPEFFEKFKNGEDFLNTGNFHFNDSGKVIKNGFMPLLSTEQMKDMPMPYYGGEELIFKRGVGFVPVELGDYLNYNQLAYHTIWSIGCVFKCTYCSNSKFIENDKSYRKIRWVPPEHIIREVKMAMRTHPHVSSVSFFDDSFLALPYEALSEFSRLWKEEINIPFFVPGVIPNFVNREKFQLLVGAGMRRIRMGIQSGSARILEFYKRPSKPATVAKAASIIAEYNDYMIPPSYDIIVDNPIETKEDIKDTLELIYNMPRPFTLNVYSLMVIPNTDMYDDFLRLDIPHDTTSRNFCIHDSNLPNNILHLLTIVKPPRWFFDFLMKRVKGHGENNSYPTVAFILRITSLAKRVFSHIISMDFSVLPGRAGWILWKMGIIGFWNRRMMKKHSALEPFKTEESVKGHEFRVISQ